VICVFVCLPLHLQSSSNTPYPLEQVRCYLGEISSILSQTLLIRQPFLD